jgi:predicted Fe-S protein YdhL (DUF1289 family)
MTESDQDRMKAAKAARDENRTMLRAERRAARRALLESGPPSPCIAVCQYNAAAGWCIGCYRTLDEIREWPITLPEDRVEILRRCAERREKNAVQTL